MLERLHIRNFALIKDVTINFEVGFTVLTGETGAGKSIMIDSLSYVLGNKFNKEFIRSGEEETAVTAYFDPDSRCEEFLRENDIPQTESGFIVIERENSITGKGISKVNGINVQAGKIKQLGALLLDIHGQHNNQNLLDAQMHIEYLDRYGSIEETAEFSEYRKLYEKLKEKESRLSSLTRNNERDSLMDFLSFKIGEIKDARISEEEENTLRDREKLLSNSQKIQDSINSVLNAVSDDVLDNIRNASRSISGISEVVERAKGMSETLDESYYNLEDIRSEAMNLQSELYFDPNELDSINQRLYTYDELKKKYGETVEKILLNLKSMEEEMYDLENAEEIIKKLKAEIAVIKGELIQAASELRKSRQEVGKKLSKKINEELSYVGLGKADFVPEIIKEDTFYENGMDSVHFMISTNRGEPLKPLEKTVSGGELSRIMLAMKAAFIDKDRTPTVIFDEIDTGISGRIAESVGEKMYSISHGTQVLCVTHLPQIASWSDNHLIARKKEKGNRTFSEVTHASEEEKIMEIAAMTGTSKVTESNIRNAEEMIKEIKRRKGSL